MSLHSPSAEDKKGANILFVGRPRSNCLMLNLLLFNLQQILQKPAEAGTNQEDAATHDEENGEDGQGSLGSIAAFPKTEEQEESNSLLCFSCREKKWRKEETENMEHCLAHRELDTAARFSLSEQEEQDT